MATISSGSVTVTIQPGEQYRVIATGEAYVDIGGGSTQSYRLINGSSERLLGGFIVATPVKVRVVSGSVDYAMIKNPVQNGLSTAQLQAGATGVAAVTESGQLVDSSGLYITDAKNTSASLLVFISGEYNADTDYTTAIQSAVTYCTANGLTLRVPELSFKYSGLINGVGCSIIGSGALSKFIANSVNGDNCRFDIYGDDLVFKDFVMESPNIPASKTNNATEAEIFLRATNSKRLLFKNIIFNRLNGGILLRNCVDSDIIECKAYDVFKDAFHITGTSKNIRRLHCTVESAGDDAFPVVGYIGGASPGQPEDIIDAFNVVRGAKFARAFAYVGAKRVKNIGCYVDGLMPSSYASQHSDGKNYRCLAGLYIASESSFNSYGNEDVVVTDWTSENCGYTSEFTGGVFSHVTVQGRTGTTTRNINISGIVKNSCTRAVIVSGGISGGVERFKFTGSIYDTTDPNGWVGTAGAGGIVAIECTNTKGVEIDAYMEDLGRSAITIGANCTGIIDIKAKTKRVNKTGTAGDDIVLVGASSQADAISIDVEVLEQSNVSTSGNAYYIDRVIECNNAGKIRHISAKSYAQLDKSVVLGMSAETLTVGASPYTYTNSNPYPVILRIIGGTVSLMERAVTTGVTTPVYGSLGTRRGHVVVMPGESVRTTYSSAPTATAIATIG